MYDKQRWETLQDKDILTALNEDPEKVLLYLKKIGRLASPDLNARRT